MIMMHAAIAGHGSRESWERESPGQGRTTESAPHLRGVLLNVCNLGILDGRAFCRLELVHLEIPFLGGREAPKQQWVTKG